MSSLVDKKPEEISKYGRNTIQTALKVMQILKIWRMWLKEKFSLGKGSQPVSFSISDILVSGLTEHIFLWVNFNQTSEGRTGSMVSELSLS